MSPILCLIFFPCGPLLFDRVFITTLVEGVGPVPTGAIDRCALASDIGRLNCERLCKPKKKTIKFRKVKL
ncbi:hypothetical protein Hanom_Chr09g00821771 [Helianthus anomalus]